MNALPIKTGLKWVGLWTLLVSIVVLLTAVFSFLGTISCAVVAGMAMAASRLWNAHVIASSLVFPGVVLALAQSSKIDLVPRERVSVAAVCFGAYWVTFLVTFILLRLERRDDGVPPKKAMPPDPQAGSMDASPHPNPEAMQAGFGLHALQGRWHQEVTGASQPTSTKTIEICGDRFIVRFTSSDGNARVCGEGVVKLGVSEVGKICPRAGSGADAGPAAAGS